MPSKPAKPLVYLETSFVSYLTAPFSADEKIAREQLATRRWLEEEGPKCELIVSDIVVQEAGRGNPDQAKLRLAFLEKVRTVPETPQVQTLTKLLLDAHALPPNSVTDASHIAIAAVHGADIVLTWNCRHIANPITLPLTVSTLHDAGYKCPALATPAQLLEARNEESPA